MAANAPATGTPFVLDLAAFAGLIPALRKRGYEVVAPTIRGSAIVYDTVTGVEDLPAGWTGEQEKATYRLRKRPDGALFGYAVGAHGWKRFLHPAELTLWRAEKENGAFRILPDAAPLPRYAFLGMRSCELAAMAIQDRVLLGDQYSDAVYSARRREVFLVAVNCTTAARTCFCASLRTGPPAEAGFDLALTELAGGERHVFVAESGSREGAEVLQELGPEPATDAIREEAAAAVRTAVAGLPRRVQTDGLRDRLYEAFESAQWEDVAGRCLSCGNCTMVCPTCFCTTVEDGASIDGARAERTRKWDSCFTQGFSYIHGGSVRMSPKSRYRQWLLHKFAAWHDQFGSCGCVGCGRCITWCPAGIDITREIAALSAAG